MKTKLQITKVISILLMLMFIQTSAFSQKLLKDINTGTATSYPEDFIQIGDMVYFTADDIIHGKELWITDGTDYGTRLVKDIYVGDNDSYPRYMTEYNGILYFTASTYEYGNELWKSDGTEEGTVLVKDICSSGTHHKNLITSNGMLFFLTDDGLTGEELWKTDGTEAGTVLVKDIAEGIEDSDISELFDFNGTLYFRANDNTGIGSELWKSDGTEAGTVLVKDIEAGSSSSYISDFNIINGELLFYANVSSYGEDIWKTDGTEAGTVIVKDIDPDDYSYIEGDLIEYNNELYFCAYHGTSYGYELWKTDGTETGTVIVKDIVVGDSGSDPENFYVANGYLFFTANDGTCGNELWKTDGTETGTTFVKDLNDYSKTFKNYTSANGKMFFSIKYYSDGYKYELWSSDGTEAGTVMLYEVSSEIYETIAFEDNIYFKGYDVATELYGLWKSDGTVAGTVPVKNMNQGSNPSSGVVESFIVFEQKILFAADDKIHGTEVWTSDGTEDGTTLLKDIVSNSNGSSIKSFVNIDGITYFSARDLEHGTELWRTDGTTEGTFIVKDIYPGAESSNIWDIGNLNGTLFFNVYNTTSNSNYALWKSDGTEAGTEEVISFEESFYPRDFFAFDNKMFFTTNDPTYGIELWISDGTEAGTFMIKDINPSGHSVANIAYIVFENELYFFADDGTHGRELWKTDGTELGTIMVKDILAGSESGASGSIIVYDGALFLSARDVADNYELWKSDGTELGTVKFKEINATSSSNPYAFAISNGTLFFSADDDINGRELWKTDGTVANTVIVKNITANAGNSAPAFLTDIDGTLFFRADDITNGTELWKSDGTESGTVMVKDIRVGSFDASPHSFTNLNGTLYFIASDGYTLHHNELWESDGTEEGTNFITDINKNIYGSGVGDVIVSGNQLIFVGNNVELGAELWEYTPTLEYAYITTQADDAYVCENTDATFTIIADNATSYQWQVDDGTGYINVSGGIYSGETTSTLTVTAVTHDLSSNRYRCMAQNTGGNTQSAFASLYVKQFSIADAGANGNNLCGLEYTLSANELLEGEEGAWTITSGGTGTFDNENLNTATFTADADGTYILTWTIYNDECESSSQVEITLAADIENPVLTIQNYTAELDEAGNTTITMQDVIISATDNCVIADTTISQTTFDCSNVGTVNIDVTLTDISENETTEVVEITVEDNIAPIMNCINNTTVTANQYHVYVVDGTEFDPTDVTDNCGVASIENDVNDLETLANEQLDEGMHIIEWTITDNNGNITECAYTITVNVYSGLNDLSETKISVYPNPTTGIINLEASVRPSSVSITDITGKVLEQSNFNSISQTYDLSNYPSGIYFIKIQTENEIYTTKIIKE